jgi:flagellum-specific peptidoglycan hydrolase FlgJ
MMLNNLTLPGPVINDQGLLGSIEDMFKNMSQQHDMGLLGLGLAGGGMGSLSSNPMLALLAILGQNQQPNASQAAMQKPAETAPAANDLAFMPNDYTPLSRDKSAMLQQLKQYAAMTYPDNPIMQQVAITQAIQESGLMGEGSQLATRYNNLFGIKAPGTAGRVNMPTFEDYSSGRQRVNANFGANKSPIDSFMQHKNLLTKSQRYQPVLAANNPYDAFAALKKSGYATDRNYVNNLSNVYNRYVAPLY